MNGFLNSLVVSIMLYIIQTSASDVLQCKGGRQSDGQFYFKVSHNLKKDVDNCETQWLVNGTVVGISDAGEMKFFMPVVNLTVNTATLQNCPEHLQCQLICLSANIHEKRPCSCEASPSGTHFKEEATPEDTLSEVGSPNKNTVFCIATSVVGLLLAVIVCIVIYKRKRSKYTPGNPDEVNV